MAKLDSATVALTKLFSQDFFFRIPEYQRPFLWDDENFNNLIDDLESAGWDEPYFLGTLVLHKSGESQYDVVDGQQRLTALCILFACMRDALPSEESDIAAELHDKIFQTAKKLDAVPSRNRLQVKDQSVFNAMISTKGGTNQSLPNLDEKDTIGKRYESARLIFSAKLRKMSPQKLADFAIFITQKCMVIYLATDSFEDAFRLFTVVNDRGKQLRRIDVLKAYNLDPRAIPSADSRTHYAHQWEAMEQRLGEVEFEHIFHLLRLIYVKEKTQYDLHKEFTEKIFGKDGSLQRGIQFMDVLDGYVDLYDGLFIDRDILDEGSNPHVQYHSLMEAMVTYFPASEWKACALLFAKKFQKDNLYAFVLELEKTYLDHWVLGTRKDERYGVYTSILKTIDQAKDASAVIEAIKVDTANILKACRQSNFYNTSHAKYLLVRAEIVASELDHKRHFTARSIEHILPQHPKAGSEWESLFTAQEQAELVDSVGNLVLLSKSKNSKASNKEFEDKKKTYLADKVSDFPRSMQVLGYSTWTPEIIRQRTEEFASTVLRDP
ncbi:DUF262 domain-containing protein [Herbidospora sp. NEAU-GS84]|uniref:DUF262 domain-containing protein n=1 Tax=Herbidospora solisilvae TaxID=2696284 RepID=A0A7C9J3U0_9ACTN|nr:DUF262 domain-containing protein [Herbidospora solisilvae]NAS23926.1 DUF262 domain-containing protein [Herbidospora solisilvae]